MFLFWKSWARPLGQRKSLQTASNLRLGKFIRHGHHKKYQEVGIALKITHPIFHPTTTISHIRPIYTSKHGYGSIPINTIFRGMNIHLPAILMFTRGTRFWHTATSQNWEPKRPIDLCQATCRGPHPRFCRCQVMGAQFYDALVTIPGCDKNMPGCVMAMIRMNRWGVPSNLLRRWLSLQWHTLW